MSSAINRRELLEPLKRVLADNKRNIFDDTESDLRIIRLSLSRPLHRREDRYHQILNVTYASDSGRFQKKLWLKFRQDFEALFKIHTTVYEKLGKNQQFLPKPYFYTKWNQTSVIGMELINGASLRNMVLRKVMSRRTGVLEETFFKIGRGMRVFHDSSAASGTQLVAELAATAHRVTAATEYLTDDERKTIIQHVQIAERDADPQTELPLIKIHNDWVLRNILIRDSSSFYVVDLDSMRAPNNSRWYDVSYFLINVESQLKYWPIINKKSMADLWQSFWLGYLEKGSPDALSSHQIRSLIYLIKVRYLFGATIRPPLFKIYNNCLGPVYLRHLKKSIMQGKYSTLAAEP
jgi:hypothetical protein